MPARLARFLSDSGHDAVHTSELPDGNRSTDSQIADLADSEGRVVVTEDRDFRDGHLLSAAPRRLLVATTGNVANASLLALFESLQVAPAQGWVRRDPIEAICDEHGAANVYIHRVDPARGEMPGFTR